MSETLDSYRRFLDSYRKSVDIRLQKLGDHDDLCSLRQQIAQELGFIWDAVLHLRNDVASLQQETHNHLNDL